MIPGVRSLEGLKDVSLDWKPWCDDRQEITTIEAYTISRNMFIKGIMGGPSSGFALTALLKFLKNEKVASRLDAHRRGPSNEVIAVFVCPDLQHVYQEKYLTHMKLSDWKSL
jgi:cysteine synthase A